MTTSVLNDAFAHHIWATQRVIDACTALTDEQLEAPVPGTFGPIIATLRHLVAADTGYLFSVGGGRNTPIDEESDISLAELRSVITNDGAAWMDLLSGDIDPDRDVVRMRDDGSESHAPVGIRLAQVIHHGTDHRSQICTALTSLGVTPPDIDVWDFGAATGRTHQVPAPAP